ncbi:MAG: UDP-N-acetyl-D-mannosamine dehydrogenase [Gammaproteobacteria bacterium]|nr:UDP-N-acetyl-D-mannosamine dehydrogenase [Gammaproteobacteria bacterium]
MICSEVTVCVIGLGYIGLPTAAILASKGYQVAGCDVLTKVVNCINQGMVHIVESDLNALVKSAVDRGKLQAFLKPQPSDIYIIAVPTPFKGDHIPDLRYVQSATESLAPLLKAGDLIILESTSPVGTTDKVSDWLMKLRPDLNVPKRDVGAIANHKGEQIYIAHCPERVLPGKIIRELVENDRIIGGIGRESAEKASLFYSSFIRGEVLLTSARTAELAKLAENAYRDVNIAFANELANICSEEDVVASELIALANKHPRVNILSPGIGVGGHCIAVDPWFIVNQAKEKARIIRTARLINDERPYHVIKKVAKLAEKYTSPKIACLGLSYKPNIDDLRESPAVQIVASLLDLNVGEICIVEPNIASLPEIILKKSKQPVLDNMSEELAEYPTLVNVEYAVKECDIVVVLVEHAEFTSNVLSTLKVGATLFRPSDF